MILERIDFKVLEKLVEMRCCYKVDEITLENSSLKFWEITLDRCYRKIKF